MTMKSFFALCVSLLATAASAQEFAPELQIKKITIEVINIIKQDKNLHADNRKKINELVEANVRLHFNFERMAALATGRNWVQATAEQQKALTNEFRSVLVRSYAGALYTYRNLPIEFIPMPAAPGDTEITVRTQIKQPGIEPINIDYSMGKTSGGWMVYDIVAGGVSLVTNYRETFNAEIRDRGVDGLIKSLVNKNRSAETRDSSTPK